MAGKALPGAGPDPGRPGRGPRPGRHRRLCHVAEGLSGPCNAPYGIAHGARQHLLTAVSVTADSPDSPDNPQASARLVPAPDQAGAIPQDAPATMIDAFAAAPRLGQVLLYALDGADRARSGNMWMRRTRAPAGTTPARPGDEVTASLEQARLLPSPAGTRRTADVIGSLHGVQVRAGCAHLLPRSWPATHREEGGR